MTKDDFLNYHQDPEPESEPQQHEPTADWEDIARLWNNIVKLPIEARNDILYYAFGEFQRTMTKGQFEKITKELEKIKQRYV
ncbi:MAG: hypothetical protein FJ241_10610 [Nitrospira sp.]|nr:hypothetical protein [Nitrospira sp.]